MVLISYIIILTLLILIIMVNNPFIFCSMVLVNYKTTIGFNSGTIILLSCRFPAFILFSPVKSFVPICIYVRFWCWMTVILKWWVWESKWMWVLWFICYVWFVFETILCSLQKHHCWQGKKPSETEQKHTDDFRFFSLSKTQLTNMGFLIYVCPLHF